MAKRTTTSGYWRQRAGSPIATPAVSQVIMRIVFDGAQPTGTPTGVVMPKGCIIFEALGVSEVVGGSIPRYDVGTAAQVDGIINGQGSDLTGNIPFNSLRELVEDGLPWTEDAEIVAGDDGSGTPGTGNITVYLRHWMADDGSFNN